MEIAELLKACGSQLFEIYFRPPMTTERRKILTQIVYAIFPSLFCFPRTQGTLVDTLFNSLQNACVPLNWFFKTKI